MSRVKWLTVIALVTLVFQQTIRSQQTPAKTAAAAPPAHTQVGDGDALERRKETFRIVWQTVKDFHFDPTFGGLDWDAVRDEFAPRVARTQSDRELHLLLQEMLNRLKQSHFIVIPPEIIPTLAPEEPESSEPDDAPEDDMPEPPDSHGSIMTELLTHGIGVDLRIINGAAVITRVDPASSAARAGLRPGFVLRSVNGYRMSAILRRLRRASVYQPVMKHQLPAEIVVSYLNGAPGTYARISYLDARNVLRRASLKREKLKGEMSPPYSSMPSQFIEFESKRLRNGIGYIRFNLFAVPVMDKFCAALRSMSDAPGIIIDLRGNRGGILALLYGMGGLLANSQISFGEMKTRAGIIPFNTIPQRKPYMGQLVVLIDAGSLSASEVLASGLQESGRAVVIGEQSGGSTLASIAKELPTGAILQYAFADFITWYGKRIEGFGVKPDINVKLDRRSLLEGRDPQLEAAISAVALQAPRLPSASIITAEQPPAPMPAVNQEGRANDTHATTETPAAQPSEADNRLIDQILEKYVQAIGGRAAVEKISTRQSKGTFDGSFSGIPVSGTIETVEKAPNMALSVVTFPNSGVWRRGFTGTYAYEQISLYGFREIKGMELDEIKLASDLHSSIKLKELYPKMLYKGKEKLGDQEAHVIEAAPASGRPSRYYFGVDNGLLLRKDYTYFEDYRQADGIMFPFRIRTEQATISFTEVKHNLAVEDSRFVEQKDCFTQ